MAGPPFLYNITLMLNRASETRRLTTSSHGQAIIGVMNDIAERHAHLYAWMVMPDHIHLLFGRDEQLDDVDDFAGRVKRRINKAFERRDMAKLRWVDGCTKYDVAIGELRRARDYILANPVRGQLVKQAEDWELSGTPAPLPDGA
ncbi:MAG: transposase [Planctomycetes bacterium]|nr:transposase [Planctomycetota bacterium]